MNGRVIPVSGISFRFPAAMMNACVADHQGEAGRQQRPELVGGGCRDPQPALDDDEEQAEDRHHPDEPELLAERGEREVRVDRRDRQVAAHRRQTRPEPRPEQPATCERVQRLDDLVAAAVRALERVEPDVHPGLDGREVRYIRYAPARNRRMPDDDVADPAVAM